MIQEDKMTKENWNSKWKREEFGGIARTCAQIIENELLDKWCPKKGTIIEAGCGLGRNLLHMSKCKDLKLIGIDYYSNVIKKAKKLFKERGAKAKFILGDISSLKFEDNSVDLVFNQGVIEHFQKPEESLKEMIRVTKKRIIVIVPNALSFDGIISIILKGLSKCGLYDYKTRFPYDWKIFFTKKSLCNLLRKLNCKIVYSKNR